MMQILLEGGNVWQDVTDFDHKDIPAIANTVNNALKGTGISVIPVGSAATPTPGKRSGDMDVVVDQDAVLNFFKAKDAKTARKALNDYIAKQGLQTAQTGINVHVRVPVNGEYHQVDIMVTPNATNVAKFHTHSIPSGSPYKGVNKQLMLAILAKSRNLMWSAWQGLFSRDANGKKADFITDDMDKIAKALFGGAGKAADMGSVEAIMSALPEQEAQALLAKAKADPNWKEVQNEELNDMKKLAGLSENMSHTATEKANIAKEKNIKPGTSEWFKLWFSLPFLTGEKPE